MRIGQSVLVWGEHDGLQHSHLVGMTFAPATPPAVSHSRCRTTTGVGIGPQDAVKREHR
jgi:hypothetical protein